MHLPEFEIFKCQKKDLLNTENAKLLKKRSIMEPISFLFNTKKYETINNSNQKMYGVNTILSLANSILKLSYKDFIELFKTIDYQREVFEKSKNTAFIGLKLKKDAEVAQVFIIFLKIT